MKLHIIKVKVPLEKRSLFGIKKTVYEERVIEVDDKTYRKLKKSRRISVLLVHFMTWKTNRHLSVVSLAGYRNRMLVRNRCCTHGTTENARCVRHKSGNMMETTFSSPEM